MPTEKSDLLQGTLDMLILKIVALGPVHGYGIPCESARFPKRFCRFSKVRFIRPCIASKNAAGLKRSGESQTRAGKLSFTNCPQRAASNWRAKNRTGIVWRVRLPTSCKLLNRS